MISKISNFLPSNKISGMMNLGSMDNRKNKTLIFGIIAILLIFCFFLFIGIDKFRELID